MKPEDLERKREQERLEIEQLAKACESCGLALFGKDFLLKTLAVLYCYGGGPGGEYFRQPFAQAVLKRASSFLEEAVIKKDWEIVKRFQGYVAELQDDRAPWLGRTLDKLGIPPMRHSECWMTPAQARRRFP